MSQSQGWRIGAILTKYMIQYRRDDGFFEDIFSGDHESVQEMYDNIKGELEGGTLRIIAICKQISVNIT